MTKFQDEKRMIFEGRTFSDDKKNDVLQHMTGKKKIQWKPAFAIIGVIAIALLIWFNPLPEFEKKHAFTEASIEQAYYDMYSADGFPGVVKYVELNKFEEQDAILITQDGTEDDPYYVLYYAMFEDDKWNFIGSTGFNEYDEENYTAYRKLHVYGGVNETPTQVSVGGTSITSNNGNIVMLVGAFNKDNKPERVIIGNEDTIIHQVKGLPPFWIAKVQSEGTPVYYVKNHKRERVVEFGLPQQNASLPVIEESPTDMVVMGTADMHGAYDTFYDYNLVVDPGAYDYAKPQNGDVVLLKTGQFARILVTDQNSTLPAQVTITEGTVLVNGFFIPIPYMMAHYNGSNVIYYNSLDQVYMINEGQYFAKADNWLSGVGFEGIVMAEDIVGKVKGYSLMTIEENWPVEVVKAYSDFKKNYDDNTLKGLEIKFIPIMQKYAEYVGDYRTMYELFAVSTMTRSYEDWLQVVNKEPSEAYRKRLLYHVDLLMRAGSFNEKDGKVEHIHPITNERKFAVNLVQENGVWKIKYETIINLNY